MLTSKYDIMIIFFLFKIDSKEFQKIKIKFFHIGFNNRYDLVVEGCGLLEVMNVLGVKGTETYSNHIMEMEAILGIEAAYKTIMNEIKEVMKSHGITVDIRHIGLLAEVMTYKGPY